MSADLPDNPGEDALLELEMRVARRADELARTQQGRAGLNLHCWLVAEAEVFRDRHGPRDRPGQPRTPPFNPAA